MHADDDSATSRSAPPDPEQPVLTRRRLLGGGLALSAAASVALPTVVTPAAALRSRRPSAGPPAPAVLRELAALEARHGARLGVDAVDHATGRRIDYRADVRFAFCSVYKAPLVASVLRHDRGGTLLNRVIRYGKSDLVEGDFVTGLYLTTGLTVRSLCVAALTQSDNVAANLLLELTGGPRGLTGFLRSIGDSVTRVDRNEPGVNTAIPGDLRDTTTPRAIGADITRLLLGSALAAPARRQLLSWMREDMVNVERFRAAVPAEWQIADKTGTGNYGVANDVGVVWTPQGRPITVAVLTTKTAPDADPDDQLVAGAARLVIRALAG